MTPSPAPRTAVVLAAGGLVGQAFHLGVLTALQEVTGFDARSAQTLVGTSAGSLVAADLAGGLSAADLRAELLGEPLSAEGRRIRGTRPSVVLMPEPSTTQARRGPLAPQSLLAAARRPWSVRPGAVASSLLPAGRTQTEMIARSLQRLHGGDWPERDLRICAVRARDARRVVFGTPVLLLLTSGPPSPLPAPSRPTSPRCRSQVRPTSTAVSTPPATPTCSPAIARVLQPGPQDLPAMGLNPMQHSRVEDALRVAADSTRARLESQPALVELLAGG
jgi:hypothetical protein